MRLGGGYKSGTPFPKSPGFLDGLFSFLGYIFVAIVIGLLLWPLGIMIGVWGHVIWDGIQIGWGLT